MLNKILFFITFIIFIFAVSAYPAQINLPFLWTIYENEDYNFSFKHPKYLGISNPENEIPTDFLPNKFTSRSNNCHLMPPDPTLDLIVSEFEKILENQNYVSINEKYNKPNNKKSSIDFILASGEWCRNEISFFVFNNKNNIDFDTFIDDSYQIFMIDPDIKNSKIQKISTDRAIFTGFSDINGFEQQVYYHKLTNNNVLIIISDINKPQLNKIIKTIKTF